MGSHVVSDIKTKIYGEGGCGGFEPGAKELTNPAIDPFSPMGRIGATLTVAELKTTVSS
jgi:hypothetical protein